MTPSNLIDKGYYWLDEKARDSARLLARRISRRSFLGRFGMFLAGAAVLPLLVGEHRGVLGIGSRNPAHYHASMGTLYLRQLADVLSRLLISRVR